MKKLKELYQQSLQELCHTKTVVLCGLLAALAIVLSMVASIQLGPYIKIGFSGLPNRIVEFLFGPAVGCRRCARSFKVCLKAGWSVFLWIHL